MRLRRADGQVYMDRWGIERSPWFGIYVHRFTAPDPGIDLHDHPWTFWSLVLKGGYTEERCDVRDAPRRAFAAEVGQCERGRSVHRRRFSVRSLRLDECHRIVSLDGPVCWTLVVHGSWRRKWGFYLPAGFVESHVYGQTVRSKRRDLWEELGEKQEAWQ